MSDAARAFCMDASVLVKLYIDEPGSDITRERCLAEPARYTTPFCFYEALNIFKSKWKYQGRLSADQYNFACTGLIAWYGGITRKQFVRDPDLTAPSMFQAVRELVQRTGLDFSDAYQVLSVKAGYFAPLRGESSTVLATTDVELARVARAEGLLVWEVDKEASPRRDPSP